MAERRMLTKKVTDDEHFFKLSSSAQALYLHLSMSADDDGFCNQVSVSMFKAHASVQDLEALLEMRYIYQFENGVIVIKHWRMANALRKDRYTPTAFQEELARLGVKENGAYTWLPNGCQTVAERLPQVRLGQDSLDKDSVESVAHPRKKPRTKSFVPPTLEEIKAYCDERGSPVDPQKFFDYFSAGNWTDSEGKPVKSWKQKLITWEGREKNGRAKPVSNPTEQNTEELKTEWGNLYDNERIGRELGIL